VWSCVGSLLEDSVQVHDGRFQDIVQVHDGRAASQCVASPLMSDAAVVPAELMSDADEVPAELMSDTDEVPADLMSDTDEVPAVTDSFSAVATSSPSAVVDERLSEPYDAGGPQLPATLADYSHTPVIDCHATVVDSSAASYALTLTTEQNAADDDDYRQTQMNLVTAVTNGGFESSSLAVDDLRPFYRQDDRAGSSPQHHRAIQLTEPPPASRGFSYTTDGLSGNYPVLPMRSDGPLQSLEGLAADNASYMAAAVMSPSYVEAPRPSLIDSSSSYSMALPPYPATEVDQSKLVNRIPSYLPYAAARTAVETPRTTESPTIYGRSMPAVAPAFPSDAFTKEFFGQYLHDTTSGPLHPLATHGSLHDQHAAAAAGILGGYQQSSTLPTMPHGAGGSELFRRAYSGVSDNLFGGMKTPAQSTLGGSQAQHWMSPADATRRWNHTPPVVHSDVPRYAYPPGRTDLSDNAKSLPPAPAPMSKRPDDLVPVMFASTSSASSSVHYPLSGSAYSPPAPGPPPYAHPSLPSSHRQLEDAYRQMTSGDYRSLAHHRTPSEMYGSALSSLDRYYYTARDAMYRSQQLAAAAMPHAFMPQTTIASQYSDRGGGYVRESLPTYGQCPTPAYGFMCPPAADKQYLPLSSRAGEYLESSGSQDTYSRHSVIYNMMPRYF